ncbi:hypothetical protein OUZ56_001753 [Daphnia magna]|uniref:Uncharacterized protein n=1 Tax=Daphnia magna TaxID=35525 RepID=A0ABR0A3M3_9CRUS|nr:hypothetical protein OUZ56_001753 [Daphnia magna]
MDKSLQFTNVRAYTLAATRFGCIVIVSKPAATRDLRFEHLYALMLGTSSERRRSQNKQHKSSSLRHSLKIATAVWLPLYILFGQTYKCQWLSHFNVFAKIHRIF